MQTKLYDNTSCGLLFHSHLIDLCQVPPSHPSSLHIEGILSEVYFRQDTKNPLLSVLCFVVGLINPWQISALIGYTPILPGQYRWMTPHSVI